MRTKVGLNINLSRRGFTSVEMLVATAIVGVVAGIAAITSYVIAKATTQHTQTLEIQLPTGALNNFYPLTYPAVTTRTRECVVAPNYSAVAQAEGMREIFADDVSKAVGVFALARNMGSFNTFRPSRIAAGTVPLDTPEQFRTHLVSINAVAASVFVPYRNTPDTTVHCWSVFVLGYSEDTSTIRVSAVYDFDLLYATNPATGATTGYYATLRRYSNAGTGWSGQPSAYYEVVFPLSDSGVDQWSPSIVNFERQALKAVTEVTAIERFKIARRHPFFLMFWPDPAQPSLRLPFGNAAESAKPTAANPSPNIADSSPRKAYNHMCGRTSYMFAVPMFPSAL